MGTDRILTLVDCYLPGCKYGGPTQSISSIVHHLGDEFTFKLVTLDRDTGDAECYPGIRAEAWNRVGKAAVYYLPHRKCSFSRFKRLLRSIPHDLLYLNGFFSYTFTLKPLILRRLGLTPRCPVILAPRGHLSTGALAQKALKKRLFIALAKCGGLYTGVLWHATSASEAEAIARVFGPRQRICIARNLAMPRGDASQAQGAPREKKPGSLKVVFVSRISREKNLDGAIRMLQGMGGDIRFDVYGHRKDMAYWAECRDLIRTLPPNIRVAYRGVLPHGKVIDAMANYDLFLCPTRGENYGHAILEALMAGCPVLISDQTPWRNLEEQHIGWDLPLEAYDRFREVISRCIAMDSAAHSAWARAARAFGAGIAHDEGAVARNRQLFRSAMTGAPHVRFSEAASDDAD